MTTKVLLVFPRFNPNSFWSFGAVCELAGARCAAPPLGLITLAALLPQTWEFRLVNRNAEQLDDSDNEWADIVMTGGMMPQQLDTLAVIRRCNDLGKPVCVGGPDPTSSPHLYEAADFRVLGEAEGVIESFVTAWKSGARKGVYEAEKFKADVAKSPVPRFDLLNFSHYLYVGVQFSRGCPFNCEFCDIIELYGRVPRTKTNEQMLAELDRLYALGYRGHVDFVDDNLIGNKKALKRFLPMLKAWQQEKRYPFKFSTEASINLSDDPQLLRMMKEANFSVIFIGIESPEPETLFSMQKKQNTRRSLQESVFRIHAGGLNVLAGFIVGFDPEKKGVAANMADCIEATSIPICMVGLLTALPNTQMTRRLKREGRISPDFDSVQPDESERGDQCFAGLNFVTARPRHEILQDYRQILETIYAPAAFFQRVTHVSRTLRRGDVRIPLNRATFAKDLVFMMRLAWRLTIHRPELAGRFWRLFLSCAARNPSALESVIMMVAMYLDVGPFAMRVVADIDKQIVAIERDKKSEWTRLHPSATASIIIGDR